jgi:uncharacterized protein YjiS (DUF1127 family)
MGKKTLADYVDADASTPSPDALLKIKNLVKARRDLTAEIATLEERLKEKSRAARELDHVTLPTLFNDIGIDRLGVPAEGNAPAINAILSDYYRANIAADWSEERRIAAFTRMQKIGMSDLIRRVIHISFDPKDAGWEAVAELLTDMGVQFTVQLMVPWQTLTAALKAHYDAGQRLSAAELEELGATVGQIVKLKQEV